MLSVTLIVPRKVVAYPRDKPFSSPSKPLQAHMNAGYNRTSPAGADTPSFRLLLIRTVESSDSKRFTVTLYIDASKQPNKQ